MKKVLLSVVFVAASFTSFAQVGIGTLTPEGALDVVSTNSGLIVPRVATVGDVTTPIDGMTVYDIDEKCFKGYSDGAWEDLTLCKPAATYSLTSVDSYNGTSVIDTTGIGYNGEAVPTASTITVEVNVTDISGGANNYTLSATDATTGLTYSASGTFAATGVQNIVLANNNAVIPEFTSGVIALTLAGNATNTLALNPRIDVKSIPASATAVVDVTYGTQTWMDRNLGARRVATALNDVYSYGNYYQWGRPADGHEIVVWNGTTHTAGRGLENTTTTLATGTPANGNFIISTLSPFDWVASPAASGVDTLWAVASQGPCPAGYHVPTNTEWDTVDAAALGSGNGTNGGNTTGWDNNVETYESALKLPSAGYRSRTNGLLNNQGTYGYYWSSTVSGTNARLSSYSAAAYTINNHRSFGFSVRCLKN